MMFPWTHQRKSFLQKQTERWKDMWKLKVKASEKQRYENLSWTKVMRSVRCKQNLRKNPSGWSHSDRKNIIGCRCLQLYAYLNALLASLYYCVITVFSVIVWTGILFNFTLAQTCNNYWVITNHRTLNKCVIVCTQANTCLCLYGTDLSPWSKKLLVDSEL